MFLSTSPAARMPLSTAPSMYLGITTINNAELLNCEGGSNPKVSILKLIDDDHPIHCVAVSEPAKCTLWCGSLSAGQEARVPGGRTEEGQPATQSSPDQFFTVASAQWKVYFS